MTGMSRSALRAGGLALLAILFALAGCEDPSRPERADGLEAEATPARTSPRGAGDLQHVALRARDGALDDRNDDRNDDELDDGLRDAIDDLLEPLQVSVAAFRTVVNTNHVMPNSTLTFNSFNQPSVNEDGLVVFRARSRGGMMGMRARGIYTRDMSTEPPGAVGVIADATMEAPAPNNTGATFIEFPSIPRIDASTDLVATRGQHPPVWVYTVPGTDEETRVGTTGIYSNSGPGGALETGRGRDGRYQSPRWRRRAGLGRRLAAVVADGVGELGGELLCAAR